MKVVLSAAGRRDFDALGPSDKTRLQAAFKRLAGWPEVSGWKWMRKEWAGHARLRVGDWRVIFKVLPDRIVLARIGHRSGAYDV